MLDIDAVGRSIAATREGLAASNYSIDCAEGREGNVVFTVRALDDACEECLVPRAIFVHVLQRELHDAGIAPSRIDVIYPLDDGA